MSTAARSTPFRFTALTLLLSLGCSARPPVIQPVPTPGGPITVLPTGAILDPSGGMITTGTMPLTMLGTPDAGSVVLLLSGYHDEGVDVVSPTAGKVLQHAALPATFFGLAFDHAGKRLYASGGNRDVVYRFAWQDGGAALLDSLTLEVRTARQNGIRYPAGLAVSRDDRFLYVAENLGDSLAVVDLNTGRVRQRLPAGRYPYAVVVAPDGSVWCSAWGGEEVIRWRRDGDTLMVGAHLEVARHPSALLLNADGSRLFVASASTDRVVVIDTKIGRVLTELVDAIPNGPGEGSTPNALALSEDGHRLFVAEADNNAVAVFDLSNKTGGVTGSKGHDKLAGRIPVGWYPTALVVRHDTLLVANGKGHGTGPNLVGGPGPGRPTPTPGYTLSQLQGSLSTIPLASLDAKSLALLSQRVRVANGWDRRSGSGGYPPFEHVIYVIKENRTYDQILGDLASADGDTSLTYFPRSVTPNHHALAERFGIFDRFFVNAEVSADGHPWSTGAYATDYVEKTEQLNYSSRGRSYDYEGQNRGVRPPDDDDAAEPGNGYLWDLAKRRGITFRNFGEFVAEAPARAESGLPANYLGLKPFLEAHTDSAFPGFDLNIPDQRRMDVWLRALAGWEIKGEMPALQIVRLPNDHTSGTRAGALSPRALMADNDLALGRMIAGLSRTKFWGTTAVFVLEDDAQNGPDHVDSHRSPFILISAWNRPAVWHRFTNTTDVIRTMEEILKLGRLSQFDAFGRPIRGIFASKPDLTPYDALTPTTRLDERNGANAPGSAASEALDFSLEDRADDDSLNRILWRAMKGPDRPYPGPSRMSWMGSLRPW